MIWLNNSTHAHAYTETNAPKTHTICTTYAHINFYLRTLCLPVSLTLVHTFNKYKAVLVYKKSRTGNTFTYSHTRSHPQKQSEYDDE